MCEYSRLRYGDYPPDLPPWSILSKRANDRGLKAAVYIQDMFETGHDAANRFTVARYKPESLPLVGIGLRADRREVDKVFKGAKLHN